MSKLIDIQVPLTPDQCIGRIEAATIPISSILSLKAPVKGYVTFLKASVLGPEQYVSKIDANDFSIMPIGIWPFKTHTVTANVGSVKGTVVSTASGAKIDARFKLFPGYVIPIVIICLGLVLFACGVFLLLLVEGSGMDSTTRTGTTLAACLFLCFPIIFAAHTTFAAWHQGRSTTRFVKQLFADVAQ